MKKNYRILVLLITTFFYANLNYAQDLLIRMDSIVMKTKILEINDQSVKYKDFDKLIKYLMAYYYQNWIAGKTVANIKQTSFNILKKVKAKADISEIKNLPRLFKPSTLI